MPVVHLIDVATEMIYLQQRYNKLNKNVFQTKNKPQTMIVYCYN